MRYRRFGNSDLIVSEVGFGTWTLVTDWWGRTDDPHDMITRRARRRDQLHRHRAGVRRGRRGRDDPARPPRRPRRHRAHHQGRLRHHRRAQVPGPVGTSARLATGVGAAAVRGLAAAGSAPTASTSTSCTTRASSRSSPTTCGRRSSTSAPKARCASSASRSGPRSVGSRKATARSTIDRSCRCRPCSTCSSRSPGSRSRQRPRVQNEEVSLISRVPHASDTLSGKVTPDTVFDPKDHRAHRNRDNMLDNFEKAETLSFLWAPETGRTIGQAAIAAILANLAFTTRAADRALGRRGARVRQGLRPAAHRIGVHRRRALVVAQLRPRRPLRHAAEVERLGHSLRARCASPPTSAASSCSTSRARSSRSGASTPRRWTTSRRPPASRSRCCTSTSRASAPLRRAAHRHRRPAAARARRPRRTG